MYTDPPPPGNYDGERFYDMQWTQMQERGFGVTSHVIHVSCMHGLSECVIVTVQTGHYRRSALNIVEWKVHIDVRLLSICSCEFSHKLLNNGPFYRFPFMWWMNEVCGITCQLFTSAPVAVFHNHPYMVRRRTIINSYLKKHLRIRMLIFHLQTTYYFTKKTLTFVFAYLIS